MMLMHLLCFWRLQTVRTTFVDGRRIRWYCLLYVGIWKHWPLHSDIVAVYDHIWPILCCWRLTVISSVLLLLLYGEIFVTLVVLFCSHLFHCDFAIWVIHCVDDTLRCWFCLLFDFVVCCSVPFWPVVDIHYVFLPVLWPCCWWWWSLPTISLFFVVPFGGRCLGLWCYLLLILVVWSIVVRWRYYWPIYCSGLRWVIVGVMYWSGIWRSMLLFLVVVHEYTCYCCWPVFVCYCCLHFPFLLTVLIYSLLCGPEWWNA